MDANDRQWLGIHRLLIFAESLYTWGIVSLLVAAIICWGRVSPDRRLAESPSAASREERTVPESSIRGLNISSDGEYLDVLEGLRRWVRRDSHTGRELGERRIAKHSFSYCAICSRDGMSVGVTPQGGLEISDETDAVWEGDLPGQQPDELVTSCSLCEARNLVAAVSNKGSLWLLEFEGTHPTVHSQFAIGQSIQFVKISPTGDRLAMVTRERTFCYWDVAEARVMTPHITDAACRFASWSGDGRRLITFGCDSEILVWQANSPDALRRWRIDSQVIPAAALSGDGRLAAVSEDNRIRIWDVDTGREHAVLNGHSGVISVLQFADDDRALFSGDTKGGLRRWSVSDLREVWSVLAFRTQEEPARSLALTR